jgi:uncharacterized lipoprotein YddW (UPF0748 family)
MIHSLGGNDIFTEFNQELKKYNDAHPTNPRQIEVVGWFEGTGISQVGSTLRNTAGKARYVNEAGAQKYKVGAEEYSAVLKKKTDNINTLDLLHPEVHEKLKHIVLDFLAKHGSLVSSIIFDDRYGIFGDAVSEIAARYNIPDGYKDGDAGWIRDQLTENLKDIKNTVAGYGKKLSISSHNIYWAKEKNNQDLARWLREGIIDGEYNFQLYKNGDQLQSFKDEYERNMTKVKESLNVNTSDELPSLSVSLAYTAGEDEEEKRIFLSKEDIRDQVNYIINRKPQEGEVFPVLNSENILGFDYGNLVTKEPADKTPKGV